MVFTKKRKKQLGYFATGVAGLAIGSAVTSGLAKAAPSAAPATNAIQSGIGIAGRFAGVAAIGLGAGMVLDATKGLQKKGKKKKYGYY